MNEPIATEEEALAAVRENGWALRYVSEELRTAEVCLEAVKKMLEVVPQGELRMELLRRLESGIWRPYNNMIYKLIKRDSDTDFVEFRPRKCDMGYSMNSVFINQSVMYNLIDDCLCKANKNYEFPAGITEFNKNQIQLLTEELKKKLAEIIAAENFSKIVERRYRGIFDDDTVKYLQDTYSIDVLEHDDELAQELTEHKAEIVTMIEDLIQWLEKLKLKQNELTILGPYTRYANEI